MKDGYLGESHVVSKFPVGFVADIRDREYPEIGVIQSRHFYYSCLFSSYHTEQLLQECSCLFTVRDMIKSIGNVRSPWLHLCPHVPGTCFSAKAMRKIIDSNVTSKPAVNNWYKVAILAVSWS